jgi:hypothetical protein
MRTSTCRGCGASIIWVRTPSGKTMPLDDRSVTLWVVDPDGAQSGSPTARPIQARASHFAACPQADAFRRPRDAGDE